MPLTIRRKSRHFEGVYQNRFLNFYELTTLKKTGSLRVSTTSGSVTAALAAEPGFTANINSVSGDLNTAMSLTKTGNTYTCGDGAARVDISTVSGNIYLAAAE